MLRKKHLQDIRIYGNHSLRNSPLGKTKYEWIIKCVVNNLGNLLKSEFLHNIIHINRKKRLK